MSEHTRGLSRGPVSRRTFLTTAGAAATMAGFPAIVGAQAREVKVGYLLPVTGPLAYEAGLALNLKRWEIFRFIILKPALKAIYPALTSQFILLMLSSAVVSVISADDLTSVAANLQSQTFRSFEIYIVVTAIYLALALSFSALFKLIYQRVLNYPDRR